MNDKTAVKTDRTDKGLISLFMFIDMPSHQKTAQSQNKNHHSYKTII